MGSNMSDALEQATEITEGLDVADAVIAGSEAVNEQEVKKTLPYGYASEHNVFIKQDDDLYAIVYKYIRHVNFGNRLDSFDYKEDKPVSSYSEYTLLKSF